MQFCLRKNFQNESFQCLNLYRKISSSEVSTALRPFYFSVHPDLFGRFPEKRAINEDSLKLLSAHLEALQQQRRILPSTPPNLSFYLRELNDKSLIKLLKIKLLQTLDTKVVIKHILETCNLSTEYIDKIKSNPKPNSTRTYRPTRKNPEESETPFDDFDLFQFRVREARENESLHNWLKKNIDIAIIRTSSLDDLKEEVEKLKKNIQHKLKLQDLSYNCGWNVEHLRGCLKSLEKIYDLHQKDMKNLEGRKVVFASFSGVSLDGHVMLFTGDVQANWLDLIKNIPKQDLYLTTIPNYEFTLSQVLLKIKIARRKFMPKALAQEYSKHLSRLITTLLDYLGKNKFPSSWPETLEEFELVVESEAGPLMISPTGQIILPSTCPCFLLVDFISNNMEMALERREIYDKNKHIEKEMHGRCMATLNLLALTKDDNITPDRMISCMERLLDSNIRFSTSVPLQLHITNYYSILGDGQICIKWDWKS